MRRTDDGFTLTELLVAITILGIIMVAIGAMIVTAFRTTSTVDDRLSGSRGPKIVSRYWVPDAESATGINAAPACGSGSHAVVTLSWTEDPTPTGTAPDLPTGTPRTVTWWQQDPATVGGRSQLLRMSCSATSTPDDTTTVVADLAGLPGFSRVGPGARELTLSVTVPDKSEPTDEFTFTVAGYQAATAPVGP
jgi:prepilin-type N-terminal cleavage/methylation domain-containing protein